MKGFQSPQIYYNEDLYTAVSLSDFTQQQSCKLCLSNYQRRQQHANMHEYVYTYTGHKFTDDLTTILRQFSDLRQSYDLS